MRENQLRDINGEAQASPEFSAQELTKAQNELEVHNSASRAILLHVCQRLGRLEQLTRTIQNDVFRIRSDVSKGNNDIKEEVSGIQDQVQTLSVRLNDVASVVDLFQSEIHSQKTSVVTLSTSVEDERVRLTAVDVKIDNQRDEFDSRIQELNLKLDEIPRALAALQKTGGRDSFAGFTFRAAEKDKLSLGKHIGRSEAGGPPFTDLQPFTIPDDMKEKIENKIRRKETSKSEADKRAAADLADAYRRLQLAGYPRVTEIHMHVEQCRDEIKRAFEFIRDSNLQLYTCCESKVARADLTSIQSELKMLRNRVREFDSRGRSNQPHSPTHEVPQQTIGMLSGGGGGSVSTWSLDKYFNVEINKDASDSPTVRVSAAQVPELRVSLLEFSKNLHALRQQWTKRHVQPLNPVVKQHLDKLVSLLNDGYSVTAEEPVDLKRVELYVEKIARLLGSDFSQQIVRMMTMNDGRGDSGGGTDDVVLALDRYARSFTEAVGSEAAVGGVPAVQHATTMRVINDQKQQLEQLRSELERVVESQRTLEAALSSSSGAATASLNATHGASSSDTPGAVDLRLATQQQQLYGLQQQLMLLHRQAIQQAESFAEIARQFDQWKKDRTPIAGIAGQRVAGATPAAHHGLQHGSPLSAALRRTHSGNVSVDLDAYLAITGVDQTDRPRSQTKLDPLQVQRVGGGNAGPLPSTARTTISVPVPVARNGMLHKIQSRAQGMRPKSGVHHGAPSTEAQH